MTEIRKQIIELISNYMNKTLSEGCLIINNRLKSKKYSKIIRNKYGWISFISNDSHSVTKEKQIWFKDYHTVLWHYDITAVEKCFLDKMSQIKFQIIDWYITIWIAPDYQNLECIWKMPHKPLHLYTDQQDKDLLELLQQLQWTNKNDSK